MNGSPHRLSRGRGYWRGCTLGCLIVLVLMALGLYGAYRVIRARYPSLTERLQDQGYTVIRSQFVEMNEPVVEKTVFLAQSVRLNAGSSRGIAIVAQTAEINAVVEGNVYFWGQELRLNPSSELKQNLHVVADRVVKCGQVAGEIRGYYRELIVDGKQTPAESN